MIWTSPWLLVSFIAVYAITFGIAWKMLARLMALAASRQFRWTNISHVALFILYRIVIIAPYLVYLVFGQGLPTSIRSILFGWIIFGLVLSFIRLLGPQHITRGLWWLYGLFYDGLLHFYPYRHLLALTLNSAAITDNDSVLDLGCGTGNFTAKIHASGVRITAVDNSVTMLHQARQKLGAAIRQGDVQIIQADLLTFLSQTPTASFDKIVMINVVYAVPDRETLWRECLRVLAPNGMITATTSDKDGSKTIINEHLTHASKWELFNLRLIIVATIDYFISELSKTGVFHFVDQKQQFSEISLAGGTPRFITRCYGGDDHGVNILFTVKHAA